MKKTRKLMTKMLSVLLVALFVFSGAIPVTATQENGELTYRPEAYLELSDIVFDFAEIDALAHDSIPISGGVAQLSGVITIHVDNDLNLNHSDLPSETENQGLEISVDGTAFTTLTLDLLEANDVTLDPIDLTIGFDFSFEANENNILHSDITTQGQWASQDIPDLTLLVDTTIPPLQHYQLNPILETPQLDLGLNLDYGLGDIGTSGNIEIMPLSNLVSIVYRSNLHTSGSVPLSQTFPTPTNIALRPQGNLQRAGHTLLGWRDASGNIFAPGQTVSFPTAVSGTLFLDAHWIPSTVTVTYNGNGHTHGQVPTGHVINAPGSFIIRDPGSMSRTGHVFNGWRHIESGNVFWPGQQINLSGGGTMRLDAVWIPSNVIINYRSIGHTGGAVPLSQNLTTPGSINLRPQGNLTRTGHSLIGWRDPAGNIFAPGQRVDFPVATAGSVTLDAHWERDVVDVTYHGNGHTGGIAPLGHTINTPGMFTVRQPGNLVRTGQVFGGWREPMSGIILQPGQIVELTGSGSLRLYAVWDTAIEWLIFFDALTNTQLQVTSRRTSYGLHNNVYVGMSNYFGSSLIEVFVSNDGARWTLVDQMHTFGHSDTHQYNFIQGAEEIANLAEHIMSSGEAYLHDDGHLDIVGSSSLISNPFSNRILGEFVWIPLNRHIRNIRNPMEFRQVIDHVSFLAQNMNNVPPGTIRVPIVQAEDVLNSLVHTMLPHIGSVTNDEFATWLMRIFQDLHLVGQMYADGNTTALINYLQNQNRRTHDNSYFPHFTDVQYIMGRGFIHGQGSPPQGAMNIGSTGNGVDNGCGPFAIYNALFYLNGGAQIPNTPSDASAWYREHLAQRRAALATNPSRIIFDLESMGGFNLGGRAGTNPETMVHYLQRIAGRHTTVNYLPENLDAQIRSSRVSILLYIGNLADGYVHYVMVRYTGGGFLVYNLFYDGDRHLDVNSINRWVSQGIPEHRTITPLALITITN